MEIRVEIKRKQEYNRWKHGGREENWRKDKQQKELVKQLIRRERERRMTREIKDTKDSGMKMWRMIDKLKGTER